MNLTKQLNQATIERLAQVIIPSTNKPMYVQAKDQTNEPKDRLSCVCVPLTPLLNGLFHFETYLVIISISSIRPWDI